tara:strand:+ start:1344 stop:1508 length:165 start_codon:yes stop_codon:yes gene_type:complete
MIDKKELSHQKYESLSKEDKSKMITYAKSKLPNILKSNESAIKFQIYKYIREKL